MPAITLLPHDACVAVGLKRHVQIEANKVVPTRDGTVSYAKYEIATTTGINTPFGFA
jgi:hypothetical protein